MLKQKVNLLLSLYIKCRLQELVNPNYNNTNKKIKKILQFSKFIIKIGKKGFGDVP